MEDNPNLEPRSVEPIPELPEIPETDKLEFQKDGGFFAWMKNVLVFIVLFLVVIGSFWISFQLGKRLLLPATRGEEKIKADIPPPPAALQALQKKGTPEAMAAARKPKLSLDLPVVNRTAEAVKAERPIARVAAAPAIKAPTKKKAAVKTAARSPQVAPNGHYYKVQAAYFKNVKNAVRLADKIKASGFETYVKKVSGGFRVQTGAFRTRAEAGALVVRLKEKGFSSVIVYE